MDSRELRAEDITAENFPPIPETKFSSYQEIRAAARAINQVALSEGGYVTRSQKSQRTRLLSQWDKLPTVQRISVLEALTRFAFVAVLFLSAPSAEAADKKLTAYDKFDKPTMIVTGDLKAYDLIALVHSYEPPKGKKVFYYKAGWPFAGDAFVETTKRVYRSQNHAIRELRSQEVIHPKLNKWRERLVFAFPFWNFGTDAALKAAAGAAVAGGVN